MKYFTFKTIALFTLSLIFLITPAFGQAKINPFQIQSSTLFQDLLKVKSENSKITPKELAEKANALLAGKGLNYIFAFGADVCQKVIDAAQKQKDKSKSVKLNAKLTSVEAEDAQIILPDISFDKGECGRCFVNIPLYEFSGKDFVTSIEGRNIKFYTPSSFIFNEVVLVDEKTPSSKIRNWFVPFRTKPAGISDDGNLLYLELPFAELNELVLIIFDKGEIQFYPKSGLDLSAKSAELKEIPKEAISPNTTFIKFTKGENTQVLKYNTSCQ